VRSAFRHAHVILVRCQASPDLAWRRRAEDGKDDEAFFDVVHDGFLASSDEEVGEAGLIGWAFLNEMLAHRDHRKEP
jgi:hypothetical protein